MKITIHMFSATIAHCERMLENRKQGVSLIRRAHCGLYTGPMTDALRVPSDAYHRARSRRAERKGHVWMTQHVRLLFDGHYT